MTESAFHGLIMWFTTFYFVIYLFPNILVILVNVACKADICKVLSFLNGSN